VRRSKRTSHVCSSTLATRRTHVSELERGVIVANRDQVEGEVREQVGKATDDESMEKEGQAQEKYGDAKERVEDVADDVRDRF
jgi:uncharacterized protein YjbJ (UPF0337 family)